MVKAIIYQNKPYVATLRFYRLLSSRSRSQLADSHSVSRDLDNISADNKPPRPTWRHRLVIFDCYHNIAISNMVAISDLVSVRDKLCTHLACNTHHRGYISCAAKYALLAYSHKDTAQ